MNSHTNSPWEPRELSTSSSKYPFGQNKPKKIFGGLDEAQTPSCGHVIDCHACQLVSPPVASVESSISALHLSCATFAWIQPGSQLVKGFRFRFQRKQDKFLSEIRFCPRWACKLDSEDLYSQRQPRQVRQHMDA